MITEVYLLWGHYLYRWDRSSDRKGTLWPQDLTKIWNRVIFRAIPKQYFQMELTATETDQDMPKDSKLKSMTVFKDIDGLLRHQSRLESSKRFRYDTRYPVILPDHDPLVEKFIIDLHKLHSHAGINHMLAIVWNKFIILKGRREVKCILRKCKTLKCTKPKPLVQIMAPLPAQRIDDPVAFQNIAVNLFGPLFVKSFHKGEDKLEKV